MSSSGETTRPDWTDRRRLLCRCPSSLPNEEEIPPEWPFEEGAWKPADFHAEGHGERIHELVKAGALIAAEIDLDHARLGLEAVLPVLEEDLERRLLSDEALEAAAKCQHDVVWNEHLKLGKDWWDYPHRESAKEALRRPFEAALQASKESR